MTALLRKDLYVFGRRTWLLLAVALCLSFIPQMKMGAGAYIMVILMNLSHSSIAYDERCRWDQFAAMLPVRPQTVVLSKYVLTVSGILIGGVLIRLVGLAQAVLLKDDTRIELYILLLSFALLFNAIEMPVIYRFGYEKTQTPIAIIAFGGAALLLGGMLSARTLLYLNELCGRLVDASRWILAVAIAANAVSFYLSVRFYTNRRYGLYN